MSQSRAEKDIENNEKLVSQMNDELNKDIYDETFKIVDFNKMVGSIIIEIIGPINVDFRDLGPTTKHRERLQEYLLTQLPLDFDKIYAVCVAYQRFTNRARTKTTVQTNYYLAKKYSYVDSFDKKTRIRIAMTLYPDKLVLAFPKKQVNKN